MQNVRNALTQILKSEDNEELLSIKNLDNVTKNTGLLGLFVFI